MRAGAGKDGRASVISIKTTATTKRKAEADPEKDGGEKKKNRRSMGKKTKH